MDVVDAFVLHARDYRESSQLVELLTADQGRIGVLARGSRGARRANPLQPFRRYRVTVGGRGELRRAQAVESVEPPRLLSGHALFAALYMNELLVRLLHRDVPVPGVLDLYAATLDLLAAGAPLEPALRGFEKQLLEELGYGHRYGETLEGEPVEAGGRYTFDPDAGVRRAPPGLPEAQCYHGSALLALESGRYADALAMRDAKRLMRRALAPYLGDKPLNSRALFAPARAPGEPQE